MEPVTEIPAWIAANEASFKPPVCNKLMHKKQLSVMFVGGPNEREDFHLEHGSEFFFQMKGNMALPIVVQGKRRHVDIKEGEVFLLPSRIPHSPQRPETGSIGLVIERERYTGEIDGLRWYVDFKKCEQVLYEKYFQCYDLGRDLVPVVTEFKASDEFKSRVPGVNVKSDPRLVIDTETDVPPPFKLADFLKTNADAIAQGQALNLFEGHPDKEFSIQIIGGGYNGEVDVSFGYETWIYQLTGDIKIKTGDTTVTVSEQACVTIHPNTVYSVDRPQGTVGMVVKQDPTKNK